MPDVGENKAVFAESWDWSTQGDEWSAWMGGTQAMWEHVLAPRLQPHLSAGTILELAPGYGRVTQYLKHRCERLILVDLAENCIGNDLLDSPTAAGDCWTGRAVAQWRTDVRHCPPRRAVACQGGPDGGCFLWFPQRVQQGCTRWLWTVMDRAQNLALRRCINRKI